MEYGAAYTYMYSVHNEDHKTGFKGKDQYGLRFFPKSGIRY